MNSYLRSTTPQLRCKTRPRATSDWSSRGLKFCVLPRPAASCRRSHLFTGSGANYSQNSNPKITAGTLLFPGHQPPAVGRPCSSHSSLYSRISCRSCCEALV